MYFANSEKEYHANNHLVYSCQYHVIFCPKFRRKVLKNGIDVKLKEIFQEIADQYNFKILEMEVMPDHVHLLIDCSPVIGIHECVKRLKGKSAKRLRDAFPELTTKLPCMWTRSAFISTVGAVSLDVVRQYIENQKNK